VITPYYQTEKAKTRNKIYVFTGIWNKGYYLRWGHSFPSLTFYRVDYSGKI